ncbi:Anaerobic selenocysteine-containing dehydrogenase [Syntrophus gentianae]|uniref:Anaerobic selenocysteine-containing dehydrogenase n=1 Tax=Syntrophus gentianae TaxID=43775 RepID=A0A1H7YUU7_9BACT|nr:molybdopterin-dependent oxidoreductase [Syntrophus gentianae]SEM50012.1 Anaerobic selenocysteine-containing dehydrogenase [Syntrophus gentianae]
MEKIQTDCALCINCCGLDCYVEDGKLVKVEGTPEHWLNKGALCAKAKFLVEGTYSPNRLKYPMKKVNGKFERVSWDQALDEIAAKLKELKEKYGAHTLATWTGSVGVEHFEMAAFNQRFAKAYGSPNFFNPEGICFRTRILARQITFGRYPVEQPRNAKLIILWGHNPDASYFVIANDIRERVRKNELELIVIDVRKIPLAKEGIYLQPRPGTDAAIALAMMNVIINEGLYDKEFVDNWCTGFDKLTEHVKKLTPEWAEEVSGVPAPEIKRIARMFANVKEASILEGVGHLNQYQNGLQNERCFNILMAITGKIDRPGGWVTCPQIRLADLRVPIEEKNLGYDEYPVFHQFNKRTPPYGSASMMTEAMITGKPYPIKAFFSSGSNPALTFPDTGRFLDGLKQLELFVSIDPYMTETSELADYALPACTFLEETGIGGFPYAISHCVPYIILRKKVIEPLYESRPIWSIWSELGRRLGYGDLFPWKTDEEVAEHMFSTSGVTYQQLVDHPEGLYFGEIEYELFKRVGFATASGKVELYSAEMERLGAPGLPSHVEPEQSYRANPEIAKKYPETLLTGARHQEFIGAQMKDVSGLMALLPEPHAMIHPVTAKKYDIIEGELMGVETPRGMIKIKANVTEDIRPGAVSIPHGWAAANVNILLDSRVRDKVSGYITMRGNACRLVKLDPSR